MAIESSRVYPLKMAIFHSCASLPESKTSRFPMVLPLKTIKHLVSSPRRVYNFLHRPHLISTWQLSAAFQMAAWGEARSSWNEGRLLAAALGLWIYVYVYIYFFFIHIVYYLHVTMYVCISIFLNKNTLTHMCLNGYHESTEVGNTSLINKHSLSWTLMAKTMTGSCWFDQLRTAHKGTCWPVCC